MSFPRYPKYKDSGVEWLGQVPAHWEVCALKRIVRMQSGESITAEGIQESGEYPVFGGNGLRGYTSAFTHDGHFVLVGRQGALCGNINYGCGKFWASEHAVVASPVKQVKTVWLGEMMRAMNLNQFSVSAAQPGLSVDLVSRIATVLPPFLEQTAIAAFLDRETAKIDALVAEQQRLMELLKEKRQAVISHAVTKGLNPHAPMKSSGIEWLGDVPAHWSVAPVASRYSVQLGKMLDSTKITGDHLRPYLRVYDVQWGAINAEDLPQMDFDHDARAKFRLIPGDLLVNEGGSYPGRSAIWIGQIDECYYQKALHRMRPYRPEADNTRFFYYVMSWAANQGVFVAGGNETTIEHLPAEKLRRYRFAFPPINEQFALAAYLDTELAKFYTLTTESQRAIDLLQERRTALISAAVTGQIDVRNTDES
jgi:type I restriction enzyme S subunit